MRDFAGPKVAKLLDTAAGLVPFPSGVVARSAAKNMHLLVAGGAILDEVFGSGADIRNSVVRFAREYLEDVQEPEHDLERLMGEIWESQSRQPSYWPTVNEYREHKLPRPFYREGGPPNSDRTELPQHGVAKDMIGVRADNGTWFAVFGTPLTDMLSATGADHEVALKEADQRGSLSIAPSCRKKGQWGTEVKHVGTTYRFNLTFNLPAVEGAGGSGSPGEPGSSGDTGSETESGEGTVCSAESRPVTGSTGSPGARGTANPTRKTTPGPGRSRRHGRTQRLWPPTLRPTRQRPVSRSRQRSGPTWPTAPQPDSTPGITQPRTARPRRSRTTGRPRPT